jgi:hypothetical protein
MAVAAPALAVSFLHCQNLGAALSWRVQRKYKSSQEGSMSRACLTAVLFALCLVAFAAVPSSSADAATTVKSSKSNTSDRTTTVKSSKSNTSDRTKRMGGGGGTKGGPAGLAVSDEGAPGTKPVKGGKK